MLFNDTEEAYPGYNEDIQLEEYESIKTKINDKFSSDTTALQIRTEFEIAFNKLFDSMLEEYSHRVFDIIYVMMDCFNINETKAIRYLNDDNREKVRNFASNNFNTHYYEKCEQKRLKKKADKKGKIFYIHEDARDLFE